jgi:C-terminal processing protease CtpA/Prc
MIYLIFLYHVGLLHVGDIIKEVNGIPVFTPQQLMDIIRNADRSITLKIVPTYIEQHHTSQVSVARVLLLF